MRFVSVLPQVQLLEYDSSSDRDLKTKETSHLPPTYPPNIKWQRIIAIDTPFQKAEKSKIQSSQCFIPMLKSSRALIANFLSRDSGFLYLEMILWVLSSALWVPIYFLGKERWCMFSVKQFSQPLTFPQKAGASTTSFHFELFLPLSAQLEELP